MARISGVNLPNKPSGIALTYIHGIGRTTAVKICESVGVLERRLDASGSHLSYAGHLPDVPSRSARRRGAKSDLIPRYLFSFDFLFIQK